ncbi:hypothetical protein [Streptomyces sp. FBKL.4005]|uniref:hypothetical protein n=1 Tax=Streptomyces sp. FBKL.4005 TaxID=2015515 RepID=UPI00167B5008|nr:hypothetical protein [Streptomyces sp. FBKL.4005]
MARAAEGFRRFAAADARLERSIARDFYAHPDVHEIGRRMDEIAGDLGTMG